MRFVVVGIVLCTGCFGLVPLPEDPTSVGTTSDGFLVEGASLPDRGEGYVRGRRGEPTSFGTPEMIAALERAALAVEAEFGPGADLRIGDVGSPRGGAHLRHRSHRAGRDVDILFYQEDAEGLPVDARWHHFSRFGFAPDGRDTVFFDDARNWALVRALLNDASIEVQWIFCSRGIKSRLLRYAFLHETDETLLVRAAYVLQQPANALPHDDHFHLRIYCSAEDRASGCRDAGPRWPWLRPGLEEIPGRDGEGLDDASLLDLLDAD